MGCRGYRNSICCPGRLGAAVCILLVFLLEPFLAGAVVVGPCTDCHLMHVTGTAAPISNWPFLLRTDCVGCHSYNGTQTIVDNVPMVLNTKAPAYPPDNSDSSALAGGNLYWLVYAVGGSRHQYGHNCLWVNGKPDRDPNHAIAPGSVEFQRAECRPCHYDLTTFGCESCHQARHHDEDFDPFNPAVRIPFRFLGPPRPDSPNPNLRAWAEDHKYATRRVYGIEDPDWEQTQSHTDHNEYCGSKGGATADYSSSMDGFCRGCHQYIHQDRPGVQASGASPWLRHPSGVPLPVEKKREAYLYNTDGVNVGPYDPVVPLARDEATLIHMTGPTSRVTPGKDEVTCLSCHRAHGSVYSEMLRWDYTICGAGKPDPRCGCFVCHSTKW